MTTLQKVTPECPLCRLPFDSQEVVSTNSFGGKRTDFHERAAGTQPLPHMVHTCPRCGFSAPTRDWAEAVRDVDAASVFALRALLSRIPVEKDPFPQEHVLGSCKYHLAAKVAEFSAHSARVIADLYLRAAWCCVDEGDIEAERFFRREAAWAFEAALKSFDGVARDERAVLTYLVGELWRRIGNVTKAETWFAKVKDEIVDPNTQQWAITAAQQQRESPREWFG